MEQVLAYLRTTGVNLNVTSEHQNVTVIVRLAQNSSENISEVVNSATAASIHFILCFLLFVYFIYIAVGNYE